MIESQQNREIMLRQLALAWEEGFEASQLAYRGLFGKPPFTPEMLELIKMTPMSQNPYREEKEDE